MDVPQRAQPPVVPGPPQADGPSGVLTRLDDVRRHLDAAFLDKQEIVRLLLVCAVAGEHLLLVGPPGTAKSALIRELASLIDARYFEYLLTRFTEPNELFGPVDVKRFREGEYVRRSEGMLPEAEVVFLDEIFKSNSAILNSLLSILNERRFTSGGKVSEVPLIALFGATNEVPHDEELAALFDRFLLRVISKNLDSYHFHGLVERGLAHEKKRLGRTRAQPLISAADLKALNAPLTGALDFTDEFLAKYKGLVFQIRSEGISLSDRRVVKILKLFAASALLEGRRQATDADFFLLRHIWNTPEQAELLDEIVGPVVDAWLRDHPEDRRLFGRVLGLDDLAAELRLVREVLTGGAALSDIQLFSQLKNLSEIKAALGALSAEESGPLIAEVDRLLETVFQASKFGS